MRALQILNAVLFIILIIGSRASVAEERFAMVIGNAEYSGKSLSPLKNPTNDAVLISQSLKRTGFEVQLVMNADLRGMKKAVSEFTRKLKASGPDSIGLFYYSGHGFQANNINYLAPLRADLQDEVDAEFEAISVDWVLAKLEQAHKGPNIVILDACRNTALTRSMRSLHRGLALLKRTPRGSFISYATAPGSTAADGIGLNSPYTSAIAREIIQPGNSIEQAFKNVRREVVQLTAGEQVPWDYSSLTTDIVFLASATKDALVANSANNDTTATKVELQLWNDVKNSDSVKHLQAYLDRFPDGAFVSVARLNIEKLGNNGSGDQMSAQVEQLFAKLSSRSLIIDKPTRPHEFYANARMHELQGDYPKARQDYLKYFAFSQENVDPHYRFQAFLKIQEGPAGAREIYSSLARGAKSPTLQFVTALLNERETRVAQLKDYLDKHPDFAPAMYELSLDFSLARLGQQSLADKKNEHALLKNFMGQVENGGFLKYFLDQQLAAKQIEDAKQRLAALSFLDQVALVNPVKLNASRSNQGWMLSIAIADQASEIFVAHSGNPPRSTGFLPGSMHPTTGKPIPFPMVELPGNAKATTFSISYLDVRGNEQGPFEVMFDPDLALVSGQKMILDRFSNGWISYRKWQGKQLAYFTHLVSYRCAISKVEYGVDTESPNEEFRLEPCDPTKPHSVNSDGKTSKIYIAIPKNTEFMSIKLSYKDGTQSEVKRFEVE
ncbi:MAG: caspase family protein [Hyphomicrobiales bacterium]|nr:caspase family protein [Hyphomicrobiales bacterium]